jgi:hypothetical protein
MSLKNSKFNNIHIGFSFMSLNKSNDSDNSIINVHSTLTAGQQANEDPRLDGDEQEIGRGPLPPSATRDETRRPTGNGGRRIPATDGGVGGDGRQQRWLAADARGVGDSSVLAASVARRRSGDFPVGFRLEYLGIFLLREIRMGKEKSGAACALTWSQCAGNLQIAWCILLGWYVRSTRVHLVFEYELVAT